jgi:hypothetical protein
MSVPIEALKEQIPAVADRTLLEMVNSLTVAQGLTTARTELGPLGRLAAQLLGRDRRAGLLTDQALIDGQQALLGWLAEVSATAQVTNLAVARVATHLHRVRDAAAAGLRLGAELGARMDILDAAVRTLGSEFDARLDRLEQWRATVDLRLAADGAFAAAVDSWRSGRTYTDVPWPYQIALLARELAAGPCGEADRRAPEWRLRARIVDTLVAESRGAAAEQVGFAVAAVLDDSWRRLADPAERWLLAELLDVGLAPGLSLPDQPLSAITATTMEFASLPDEARPASPAACAVELVRRRLGPVDRSATLRGYVTQLVGEQMDAAARIWAQLAQANPDANPHGALSTNMLSNTSTGLLLGPTAQSTAGDLEFQNQASPSQPQTDPARGPNPRGSTIRNWSAAQWRNAGGSGA